jgi:glycosyltransferase involved in cell wall biosynthesis
MKVSVIIPCYNGEAFVARAIQSVLGQSCGDFECLVVDDASQDASREIVLDFAGQDGRIKPLFLERNGGPSVARNRGLDAACGEWIALLDADDYYRPDRLETLLAFAAETGADIVIDNVAQVYSDGRIKDNAFGFLKAPRAIALAEFCRLNLSSAKSLPIGFSKPVLRRAFLERHRLRLNPRFRLGEDFLLLAECLMAGARLAATPYCGYVYRVLASSLSRSVQPADLKGLSDIHDYLLSAHPAACDPQAVRYLSAKKRKVQRYIHLREMRDLLGQGRYRHALKALARHPEIGLLAAPFLWRRLAGMFGRTAHV